MAAQLSLAEGGGLRCGASDVLIGGLYQGSLAQSLATYQYGYFECRSKVPAGAGLWPAFFLYSVERHPFPDKHEVDVFEYLSESVIYMSAHHMLENSTFNRASGDISDDYHTFGVLWEVGKASFYFDGVYQGSLLDSITDLPLNLMLNLYVDGWAGPPTGTVFPVYHDVDYVKVWQRA